MTCGLTGLEIGEGDQCYVALLVKDPYDYWAYRVALPPVQGTYDDSGYLRVTDSAEYCAAWGLPLQAEQPVVWQPLDHHEDLMPVWIAGAAYDHLPNLPQADSGQLLRQMMDEYEPAIEQQLAKNLKLHETMCKISQDPLQRLESKELLERAAEDIFSQGRNALSDRVLHGASSHCARMVAAGLGTAHLLRGYARAALLQAGSFQLRRPLYPANGSYGPQFGGSAAMVSMTTRVLELAQARLPEDRQYWGTEDE